MILDWLLVSDGKQLAGRKVRTDGTFGVFPMHRPIVPRLALTFVELSSQGLPFPQDCPAHLVFQSSEWLRKWLSVLAARRESLEWHQSCNGTSLSIAD